MSTEQVSAPDFHALGLSAAAAGRGERDRVHSPDTHPERRRIPLALQAGKDVVGTRRHRDRQAAAFVLPILERHAGKTARGR